MPQRVPFLKPPMLTTGVYISHSISKEDFKITQEHGHWFERSGVHMMAMFHPAAILRDPRRRPEAFMDLKTLEAKIREVCQHTY